MPDNPTRRIPPAVLQADIESFAALLDIKDYAPANAAFSVAALTTAKQQMETKQTAETQAIATRDATRDAATDGEWNFHNVVLGAKTQIEAQYGPNSDQIQAVGRKKKTERARPARRQTSKKGTGE